RLGGRVDTRADIVVVDPPDQGKLVGDAMPVGNGFGDGQFRDILHAVVDGRRRHRVRDVLRVRPAAVQSSHQSGNQYSAHLELGAVDVRIARITRERKTASQGNVLLDVLPILEVAGRIDGQATIAASKLLAELVAPYL